MSQEQNVITLTEAQANRFTMLCERVNRGEITANQAYKYAQQDGEAEDDKGFAGTFQEWMTFATTSGLLNDKPVAKSSYEEEEKKSYVKPILIGAGLLLAVYLLTKMKAKQEEQ